MKKRITSETLRNFAYVNDAICTRPIQGIVLSFLDLGDMSMYNKETEEGIYFAEKGILYVIPYYNPWSWMSSATRDFVEEVIEVTIKKHNYVGCVVNTPVCDPVYHHTNYEMTHRIFYDTLYYDADDICTALRTISPLELVDRLPTHINYYFFHGDSDQMFPLEINSEPLVKALRERGCNVNFKIIPGMGHAFPPPDIYKFFLQYPADEIERAAERP